MRFIKFLGVGGTATALHYGILVLLVELFAVAPFIASTVGYSLSAIWNYVLNYYFTFESAADHGLAAFKFIIVVLVGLCLNSLIVYLLTEIVSVYYIASQIAATGIVLLWNFYAHKHWTYRSLKEE